MGQQRARFEDWFAVWRGKRTPQEEAEVLKVADAYDDAIESGELSPEAMQLVVDAASDKRAILWMNAVELLQALGVRFETAAAAIRKMYESGESHVRFASLCCLDRGTPSMVVRVLLIRGLADKSSRVRWKAAQRVGDLEIKQLLPELESAVARETNAKARAEINLHLRLLRDGHILEPSSDSRYCVTVRTKDGICTGYVTEQALREKGIATVAAELRGH